MTEVVHSILREEIQIEWEIKQFFDLPLKEGEYFHSQSFSFSNEKWFLKIVPQCKTDSKWTELYLKLKKCVNKYHVAATIGIKKADGSVFKSLDINNVFYSSLEDSGWGIDKFIERSELRKSKDILAPGGALTVFCSARLNDDRVEKFATLTSSSLVVPSVEDGRQREVASQTSSSESMETLSENLKNLYHNGIHGDVKIKVGDREFQAHKVVLSARSQVFSSMFEHEMAEKKSGVIEISDCDEESFQDFLFFVYSGKLHHVVSSNAIGLYETAEKYDLKELKEECTKCLSTDMSIDLVCDVVLLAVTHNESELLDTATRFFIKNAKSVVASAKWMIFTKEHPDLENELFLKFIERDTNKRKI